MRRRVVIDNNVYVSRVLKPSSVPGQAVAKALERHRVLISRATLMELKGVLSRPKLAPYLAPGIVEAFLQQLSTLSIHVENYDPIRACRDPKDDKFLEVAVHGHAEVLITGDSDLLTLHPFRGISILSPAECLVWPK